MSDQKQLDDIVVYLQNLHDRVKILENWVIDFETKSRNLTSQEEQAVKEVLDEQKDLN